MLMQFLAARSKQSSSEVTGNLSHSLSEAVRSWYVWNRLLSFVYVSVCIPDVLNVSQIDDQIRHDVFAASYAILLVNVCDVAETLLPRAGLQVEVLVGFGCARGQITTVSSSTVKPGGVKEVVLPVLGSGLVSLVLEVCRSSRTSEIVLICCTMQTPLIMAPFNVVPQLGRIALRVQNVLVAVGVVRSISG